MKQTNALRWRVVFRAANLTQLRFGCKENLAPKHRVTSPLCQELRQELPPATTPRIPYLRISFARDRSLVETNFSSTYTACQRMPTHSVSANPTTYHPNPGAQLISLPRSRFNAVDYSSHPPNTADTTPPPCSKIRRIEGTTHGPLLQT